MIKGKVHRLSYLSALITTKRHSVYVHTAPSFVGAVGMSSEMSTECLMS